MPAQPGVPFKVTFLFNQGAMGWSETYYAVSASPADPWVPMIRNAKVVAEARKALITTRSQLLGIRITRLDETGGFQVIQGPDVADGVQPTTAAEFPAKGWLMRGVDIEHLYRRSFWLRGIPATWNTYTAAAQFFPPIPVAMRDPLVTFAGYLSNTLVVAGSLDPTPWCIRAWSKDPLLRKSMKITSVEIDPASNCYWAISTEDVLGEVGDTVFVQGVKGCGTAGINGRHQIVSIIPAAGPIPAKYVLSGPHKCCSTPFWKKGTGIAFKTAIAYYKLGQVSPQRIATRRTGRAFFVPAGARRGPKC